MKAVAKLKARAVEDEIVFNPRNSAERDVPV